MVKRSHMLSFLFISLLKLWSVGSRIEAMWDILQIKNVLLLYCTCFVSGCLMITDYELQVTLIRVKRSSSEDINICLCYFSGKCFFIKNKKVIKYIFYEWVKKINILHIFFWLICTSWHHIIYRLTGHFEWCCYAEQQAYKKKE